MGGCMGIISSLGFTKDWLQDQWSSIFAGFINSVTILPSLPKRTTQLKGKHFSVCARPVYEMNPSTFCIHPCYLCKEANNSILAIVGLKLNFTH